MHSLSSLSLQIGLRLETGLPFYTDLRFLAGLRIQHCVKSIGKSKQIRVDTIAKLEVYFGFINLNVRCVSVLAFQM